MNLPEMSFNNINKDQSSSQYNLQEKVQLLQPMNSVQPERIRSAAEATKILMDQLDEHNLKRGFNKQNRNKYDSVLPMHVKHKNREEIRKQLRIMSMNNEETITEPNECIDSDEDIGRVLDANLFSNIDREKLSCPDDILLQLDEILMGDFLLEQ